MKAIAISSPLMMTVNPNGAQLIQPGAVIAKPNNTARTVCPAVMFAKSRTESDIGRAIILMISIGTMTGIIILGTPGGTRMDRK